MGPGFDQEIHQACSFSRVESVDTRSPQHVGWFKCHFRIRSRSTPCVISTFHRNPSVLWVMCCSGLMLIPPTQGEQPQLLELTEPIVLSLSYPVLSLQPCTPAGRAGKWLPRGPFIRVINALCFTKFHQSSPPPCGKTIVLYAFFFCINIYTTINVH